MLPIIDIVISEEYDYKSVSYNVYQPYKLKVIQTILLHNVLHNVIQSHRQVILLFVAIGTAAEGGLRRLANFLS